MPPRSSYAFLAAGPLMLALAAFLAQAQAEPVADPDQLAGIERAVEL